ncbi:uncharacterized protein LOC130052913 [Ostrea edulis]|uniref:uncharacterized protein LOC130052913 n=1 Tax=Ostrea edulis TaxID=37623 RepID=UPI0024AFFC6F|nr:uncharacterized protein LOC130052913 [Ostrea edulis]
MYTVGYQCSKQEVFREHDDCFVEERDIHGKGKITCPKHGMINHHILSESTLLIYWKQDVLAEITDLDDLMDRDECTSLSEPELRKFNFKTFDELTKIGRDALQLYFDRIFPPMDLATVLTNNKQRLHQGHQRLDTDQCTLLIPDNDLPYLSGYDRKRELTGSCPSHGSHTSYFDTGDIFFFNSASYFVPFKPNFSINDGHILFYMFLFSIQLI